MASVKELQADNDRLANENVNLAGQVETISNELEKANNLIANSGKTELIEENAKLAEQIEGLTIKLKNQSVPEPRELSKEDKRIIAALKEKKERKYRTP